MRKIIFSVLAVASLCASQAFARDQILSCNFTKKADQKYFTDSEKIDKAHPAFKLNLDRAKLYPSKNLNTITGIELKRLTVNGYVLLVGDDGDVRVKIFVPDSIVGEDMDDVKVGLTVRWQGDDTPTTQSFKLKCDSRAN